MTITLLQRRFIILILALLFLGTAISDLHPALAGKKIKSLSADQLQVPAGSSVEATVTINKPASSKGGVVYLSSGNPSTAKVPESVLIRPGESSALFVIDTTESLDSSSIVISALYGDKSKKLTVTVNGVTPRAISLTSLTLAPTSVLRGASAQGVVTLTSPAPSGGIRIVLSNGNPSVISMPGSLVIPAGSSQASFTIASSLVSTSTTASLSASYDGTKKTALLNISADFAALSSISVNPIVVAGGGSSQGTVTLSAPAGFAGAVVPLSSNSSVATVPASVTVPAGAASGLFTVTTSAVSGSTPVTISASYGSVTRTAQLTVAPATSGLSSLVLNPSSITGSSPSQATVNLGGPAGPGGVLVALSTDSAVASAPASVVVAPGSTSAAFTVNTSLVAVPKAVSISAVYDGVTRAATLTVLPISSTLSSLTVSPIAITGGAASQGTVTLNGAAPVGDAIITLSSSKSSTAAPPASVTVPAGFSSATFMISTGTVSVVSRVTISADYGSRTRTANLSVQPGVAQTALSSLEVSPASVIGGSSSRGTVTLTDKASSGDIVVALSSNNPAATAPASVLIPAGSATATFTIATTQVTNTTPVSISANYFGVTRSASLSVDPLPAALSSVSLNPTSVVGGNASQGTVIFSSPAPPGGAVVSLSKNDSAATLPANVTVAAGATSAMFTINTTTVSSSRSITVSAVYSGVTRTATLTVDPVASAMSSIALSPTTVVGGSSSQGTVSLSTAAPVGGAVVSLSSSNSAATVPATVTVPASATSATFTVNTTSVVSTRSITITGAYIGVTRTATLTVDPVPSALSSIGLTPPSVFGGTSSQGTVMLSTAAPSGGALISLSSNNPAATVPASVTVAAGGTSATFTINTTSVSSSRLVTISGVYTGVTRTATLTVDPIPATLLSLSLNPTSIVGGNSFQGIVTLSAGAPAGGALISLSSNNAAATVATSVTVAAGASSATFTVNTTTVSSSRSVTISAVYGGVNRTASLYVDPVAPALASLVLNPTSVIGGNPSQGTATLTSAAPPGGSVVSLSSSNPAVATVVTSVLVPGGSTSATFAVPTTVVFSTSTVTISGSCGGGIGGSTLTVQPLAADTAPPVISAVTSSGITASDASLSWTTNEASNTQVDYGTTTSYGSSTTLNTTMVTSHSANLSGMLPGRLYYYRVKSRDAAGNLGTSSVFTFTTMSSSGPGLVIEGFGRNTVGGQGGTVYTVTNLNDSGAGSLRDLLNRPGPRIIKFAVSGIIDLAADLRLSQPFVTIDGSDAPNGGICLRGGGLSIEASEVIVRYLRIRPGPNTSSPGTSSAIGINAVQNVVIDHCSLGWATDENMSIYARNVTVQWSIISEPLHYSTHPEGEHSMGILVSGSGNVSFHHNLLAHNNQRNPVVQKNGIVEWVNNVIYNGNMQTVFTIKQSAPNTFIRFDAIGNYYKEGPDSQSRMEMEKSSNNFYGTMTLYVNGNIGPHRPIDSLPQQNVVEQAATRAHLVAAAHVSPPQIAATSASIAYAAVLANAGATYPCRDSVDQRIVLDATRGTGFVINDPSQVGGWPDLTRPCLP